MPFRATEPTIPNAVPIRTEDGTLIGAIARIPHSTPDLPGWEPYLLNADGEGFHMLSHGSYPITEADGIVRDYHALLVRQGDR